MAPTSETPPLREHALVASIHEEFIAAAQSAVPPAAARVQPQPAEHTGGKWADVDDSKVEWEEVEGRSAAP